jgi:hypothetical protein
MTPKTTLTRIRTVDERQNLDKVATRPKTCRATLRIPSVNNLPGETSLFKCNLRHTWPNAEDHVERGRVKIGDKELTYTMAWREAEPEVWREVGNHD